MGGSNLTFTSVTRKQGGFYTCRGDNGFSSLGGLAMVEVIVEFGPRLGERKIIHSSQGEQVILECRVKASPEALVTWSKEGQQLSPLNSNITSEGDLHTLIAQPPVAEEDQVMDISYTCHASNAHGNATQSFLLTSRPDQPVFSSAHNSANTDSILLEWVVNSGLALKSFQLEVRGPSLNKTLSISGPQIAGPDSSFQYKGHYNLGPKWGTGLEEGKQYEARVRGDNIYGLGPTSEWFIFKTAGESSSSPHHSSSILSILMTLLSSFAICSYNLL